MDRLNKIHRKSRTNLPSFVIEDTLAELITRRRLRISPITSQYLGILGFVGCSAAIVVLACLLALNV